MKNLRIGTYLLVFVLLIGFYGAATYNTLVSYTTAIQGQWANVETQYQRRYDLIPNLVNATKGLMKQEQTVFQNIAKARTAYQSARSLPEKVQATEQMEGALGRLLAIVENYPDLKTNQAVLSLMDELSGTENRIAVERRRYNNDVMAYNAKIRTFPSNIVAKMCNFESVPYFAAVQEAVKAPQVDLTN